MENKLPERDTVLTQIDGPVMKIVMNRPGVLNAIDDEMGARLLAALKVAESEKKVRTVVLTGAGRAFSVGEDLNANKAKVGGQIDLQSVLRNKYNPIILKIRRMEKPVVAAVNGVAAGAGVGIALACDLRIASDKATFHMAFAKVGLVPDSGTVFWLVKNVGLSKASELCMLGEPLTAIGARDLGLINFVYPTEKYDAEVEGLAARLADGPTKAYSLAKRAINKALFTDIEGMLDYEAFLQGIAGRTRDHEEGVKAFFERREARFIGE